MKKLILTALAGLIFNSQAYAAGTLTCTAEDGSSLQAIVNNQEGSVPHQFSLKIRSGEFKRYPNAWANYESSRSFFNGHVSEEQVKKLIVVDPQEGILVVILKTDFGYSFTDQTGSYSADCEFGY
jgi:hypothetical protein